MKKNVHVEFFNSFTEENAAESQRRRKMTAAEREHEFDVLQKRMWGEDWKFAPMEKIFSLETDIYAQNDKNE